MCVITQRRAQARRKRMKNNQKNKRREKTNLQLAKRVYNSKVAPQNAIFIPL
jgi:hypothetical protein